MKQPTLIAILLTQTAIALSQTQTKEKAKEQSNVEIFSNRAGTLIQKEFENIGSVKKCMRYWLVRLVLLVAVQWRVYQPGAAFGLEGYRRCAFGKAGYRVWLD